MERAQDIQQAIKEHIKRDVGTFSERDQRSGYAQEISAWWNELPEDMTDEQARVYLNIKEKVRELNL